MSGPNTNFDPVQVAALEPEAVDASVEAALAAFAAASSLDELKAARSAHQGDKSPLALANREIGALPPSAKAEAGKRVGAARARVNQAAAARQTELEAERDERILVEEAIDVTLPMGRRPLGRRHPIELMAARITDIFIGMGWEIAEGPEIEAEWGNFDARNFDADHPAARCRTPSTSLPPPEPRNREKTEAGETVRGPAWSCARIPLRCRPGRSSSAVSRSISPAPVGCSAPTTSTRPTCRRSIRSRGSPSTRA